MILRAEYQMIGNGDFSPSIEAPEDLRFAGRSKLTFMHEYYRTIGRSVILRPDDD
jgi:hypothetical protein